MNKMNFDDLMYLLGEENTIEEITNSNASHEFSKNYERNKMKMIKKQNYIEKQSKIHPIIDKGHKKITSKKSVVLMASIVAALGVSITAYAAVKQFTFTTAKNEDTGTLTHIIEADPTSTKIPKIKIIPEYLPEGYIEMPDTPGKYHPVGDTSSGITIDSVAGQKQLNDPYISTVEDTTIGGIKAQILTRDGVDYNKIIYLFYEEDGQIIEIYGHKNVAEEELIKVAENVHYEVIPGSFVEIDNSTSSPLPDNSNVYHGPVITSDYIFSIGETRKDVAAKIDTHDLHPSYTVNSIEVMDKLPSEINQTDIFRLDAYKESINDDGTLKAHERTNRSWWENNKMNTETEVVGRKFLYVTLTLNNEYDEELKLINVYPRVNFLEKGENNTLKESIKNNYLSKDKLQIDNAPFYFDQSDYEKKNFFFCDLASKETKEVHLAYIIDEDLIDDAYITFNLSGYGINPVSTSPVKNYIKVTK